MPPPPPRIPDGTLRRETSRPEVYVIYGQARFWIPSPQEFDALGFNWADVKVVADGTVTRLSTIPVPGTLVKERSTPEVYVIADGAKVWVPTPDSIAAMGRGWEHVRVVPNGGLAHLPRRNVESSSPTPGSLVFPPDHGKYYPLRDSGASWVAWSKGKEIRLIEVRGWLHHVAGACNASEGPLWHDWHYDLEIDTAWAASRGIDISRLLRVGNFLVTKTAAEHDHALHRVVSLPLLHVELNGIIADGRFRPADWQSSGEAGCESTWWPFRPLHPPNSGALADGDYVRMVGSLVTDHPHVETDWIGTWLAGTFGSGDEAERNRAARIAWGGANDDDPQHDARWTEMHPPDLIQTVERDPGLRIETVRGVALVALSGMFAGETQRLDLQLRPPSPRPPYSRVGVVEAVGPETNFGRIIEGNATRTGARLSLYDDRVRIRVAVQGEGGWGIPGKFKAIYRVFWEEVAGRVAKYGDALKLRHGATPTALHSHALNYGHAGGSGQQQVTAFEGSDDNDLWRVKGPHGQPENYNAGQPVRHGEVIRLEHVLTRRNLHSHSGHPSPVTRQQEVTAFGQNGIGDSNDNWRVEVEGGGTWDAGKRIRLIHTGTNHALHSHEGHSHSTWTAGQQEVTAFAGRDDNDWWILFELR